MKSGGSCETKAQWFWGLIYPGKSGQRNINLYTNVSHIVKFVYVFYFKLFFKIYFSEVTFKWYKNVILVWK